MRYTIISGLAVKVQAVNPVKAELILGDKKVQLSKDQLEALVSDGAFSLQEMDWLGIEQDKESSLGISVEEF